MKLSDVKSIPMTQDDEDTFADIARVQAFEQLPLDSQEAIIQYELEQLDSLLKQNYFVNPRS